MYIAFDLGGINIKYAVFGPDADVVTEGSFATPADNLDDLLAQLVACVQQHQENHNLKGIALSSPGAITNDGVVEGSSAIPCTFGVNMPSMLGTQTGLPVSIENDANCAALAEVWKGALQNVADAAVVVSGTGIGGAVIKDGLIHKGAHLHGGEFGYMLLAAGEMPEHVCSWSGIGSTSAIVRKVAHEKGWSLDDLNGESVFEMAAQGDTICKQAIERFYDVNALGIFNIQYMYDPAVIAFGGGISARSDLVARIEDKLDALVGHNHDATITPKLIPCQFRNHANLVGALYHHFLTYDI